MGDVSLYELLVRSPAAWVPRLSAAHTHDVHRLPPEIRSMRMAWWMRSSANRVCVMTNACPSDRRSTASAGRSALRSEWIRARSLVFNVAVEADVATMLRYRRVGWYEEHRHAPIRADSRVWS